MKFGFDFSGMRAAGKLAAQTLDFISPYVLAGITTNEINDLCHNFIIKNGSIPAPLNYKGFPKSICTSINNVVCHGIPDDTVLKNGDIVNIDVTVILDGWHGDTSRMFCVGEISEEAKKLVEVTYDALILGISVCKPDNFTGDIGHIIQDFVENKGYSVVRDFCGHGIGKSFHCKPNILHFGKPKTGYKLCPGMCFTIEPMINVGGYKVSVLKDDWTTVTKDGSLSAQWEHTIGITENGHEVFTVC